MIPFNVPPCVGDELDYVKQAIDSHKICGDGAFTKQCNAWLEERFHAQKVLLTTSGTTALDMAMLLCDIHPGDEVILPSFTFSSTALGDRPVWAAFFSRVLAVTMNRAAGTPLPETSAMTTARWSSSTRKKS